jgi:hypothetical protein
LYFPAEPPGVLLSGMAINSENRSKIKKILDYPEAVKGGKTGAGAGKAFLNQAQTFEGVNACRTGP